MKIQLVFLLILKHLSKKHNVGMPLWDTNTRALSISNLFACIQCASALTHLIETICITCLSASLSAYQRK